MMQIVREVLSATGGLFLEMAPYLMLGLTVAGILSVIVQKRFVAKHIGRPGFGAVLKASLLGVPLPLCSCGVVPTAAYLKRAGASRPAVMSFLISTPQTGVDSIAATYGMLGPLFAVFRPIAALVTGVVGGGLSALVGTRELAESAEEETARDTDDSNDTPLTLREKFVHFLRYAYVEAVDDIAIHFVVGLLIGGAIGVVLPNDFFVGRDFGNGPIAMLLMVLIGIPMYVCSTSSIPIAVALIAKGLSPGAAYVFLVAGPATNAATLAILSRVLGRRHTILYVATLVVGSLLFGLGMERITASVEWAAPTVMAHMDHASAVSWLDWTLAGALAVLVIAAVVRRLRPAAPSTEDAAGTSENEDDGLFTTMKVEGMTCHHCAANVENAVRSVVETDSVRVDLKKKKVFIEGRVPTERRQAIALAIRGAGYEPVD